MNDDTTIASLASLRHVLHDDFGLDTLIGRTRLKPYEQIVFVPCVEIVVLGHGTEAPMPLRQPFEAFCRRWSSEIRFWDDGSGSGFRKPRRGTLEKVGARLEGADAESGFLRYTFHAGSGIEMLPPSCELLGHAVQREVPGARGAARWRTVHHDRSFSICLPVASIAQGGAWFRELLAACTPPGFTSGWVGYGILWNAGFETALEDESSPVLREWFLRFPGLGIGQNFVLAAETEGIRDVSWMTLLGSELTARKGGALAVQEALGSDFVVQPLADGLCIQAGDAPCVGDAQDDEAFALYRRIDAHLQDLRVGPDGYAVPFRELLSEKFEPWRSRFGGAI
jgi:hypothetical protein